MWQNSIELLDYALRELQVAVENDKSQVEILLQQFFTGDTNSIRRFVDTFELKIITEMLREEFINYDIKSVVRQKGLNGIITFEKGPCALSYPLVWELTLRKK